MEHLGCGVSRRYARNTASEVQLSVFEFRLSPERLARLIGEVQDVIDTDRDSVMVYRFSGQIDDARLRIGRSQLHDLGQPWVL